MVVVACVNCAEASGITETIKALGSEVKPMGVPLTRFLKSPDWERLNFLIRSDAVGIDPTAQARQRSADIVGPPPVSRLASREVRAWTVTVER